MGALWAQAGDSPCKASVMGQLGVCRVRVPAEKKGVEDRSEGGEGEEEGGGGAGGEGFKKRGGVRVHFCVGGRREEDGEWKLKGVRGEGGGEMRGKGG